MRLWNRIEEYGGRGRLTGVDGRMMSCDGRGIEMDSGELSGDRSEVFRRRAEVGGTSYAATEKSSIWDKSAMSAKWMDSAGVSSIDSHGRSSKG